MKPYAKQFYKGSKWEKCRASFISYRRSIDGGLCERCHRNAGYIVHHKCYLTPANITDPNISLNFDNLEYLCLECHNDEHLHKALLKCGFDKDGRPIEHS